MSISSYWELLNGVGVDGVGGIFPQFFFVSLFFSFFFAFFRFSSLFFAFLRFGFSLRFSPILLGQEQTTEICWENGEFHSDPVCTDPVQNFPILDVPAIRNANQGDSRESIRKDRFARRKTIFITFE